MYILSWICAGLAAGWFTGKALKGESYGPWMDITLGIGGAVGIGFIMRFAGFSGYWGTALTTLAAMIGAVLLTLAMGFMNGRSLSAKHL